MKEVLFVYFANDDLNSVTNDFDLKTFLQTLTFDSEKPFRLYPQNQHLENLTSVKELPDALIIYDGSSASNKLEYSSSILDQLRSLKDQYLKIYICYHSQGPINSNNYHNFSGEFTQLAEGHHVTNNPLYLTAIGFIMGDTRAAGRARELFEGNAELRILIQIWKSLSLLAIKKKGNNLTQTAYEEAIAGVKSLVPAGKEVLLPDFKQPGTLELDMKDFWSKHLEAQMR